MHLNEGVPVVVCMCMCLWLPSGMGFEFVPRSFRRLHLVCEVLCYWFTGENFGGVTLSVHGAIS